MAIDSGKSLGSVYVSVDGADGIDVELLAPGANINNIKSILFSNTDSAAITVSLFIQDSPALGVNNTVYLIKTLEIPQSVSFLFDEEKMLKFNNSINGYGLYVTVGSGDTMDVMINI